MKSSYLSILGILICGGATLALMAGDGGWNPKTQRLLAMMIGGLAMFVIFYIVGSRRAYQETAAKAGLRHVPDYTFDIAFEAVNAGFPIRFELAPPDRRRSKWHSCVITMRLPLAPGLKLSVGGSSFMNRDLGAMLKGLPKVPCAQEWLGKNAVYGEPQPQALEFIGRLGGLAELEAAGWKWDFLSVSDGKFVVEARNDGFSIQPETLRLLRDAAVKIGNRAAG